ncbi:ral guanine nucleotide dissociation stimulator-like [Sciurus carolinensis]|uniref:ral guanine nucleotide dissociation stimulator-like n=1 Tax=Sciurus carolinensis TaxID=30640 RepID=UPI001FB3EA3C|nr:ral guanine nucleotide dissociation stimulator-like [Sciurus carolinensis]
MTSLVQTFKALLQEDITNGLVPALQRDNETFLHEFQRTYQSLTSTHKLMEQLCRRCGDLSAQVEEDQLEVKNTLCSIIKMLQYTNPEDFLGAPSVETPRRLNTFQQHTMPGKELSLHVHGLLAQLEHPHPSESGPVTRTQYEEALCCPHRNWVWF